MNYKSSGQTIISISILWIFTGVWFIPNGLKILIVLAIAAVLINIRLIIRANIKKIGTPIFFTIFLLLSTLVIKEYHGGIFNSFIRSLLCLLLIIISYNANPITSDKVKNIVLISILIQLSYFIYLFFVGSILDGIAKNPNIYASLLGVLILHLIDEIKNNKIYIYLIFSILLILIILTAKTVIISVVLATIILFFNIKSITKNKVVIIFGLMVILLSSAIVSKSTLEIYNKTIDKLYLVNGSDIKSSLKMRYLMYNIGFELIKKEPFLGHGDNFKKSRNTIISESSRYSKSLLKYMLNYSTLHNVYIDSMAKLGIFILPILIILTFVPYIILRNSEKRKFGIILSLYIFIISMLDTALLGGPLLLVIIMISVSKITVNNDLQEKLNL